MPYQDWLKKHYPIKAHELTNSSDLDCVDHCINNTQGALPENLTGGKYNGWCVVFPKEDKVFRFDSETCALCRKYPERCSNAEGVYCPIVRMQGAACDTDSFEGKGYSTFGASEYDPQPLLNLLLATKEFLQKEQPPCK